MRNNRIEQFSNEKNNSMKNRKIEHNDSCDSVHSRRSTSTRCQIFVANELNRVDNRMEMHKMNGWLGRRNQQEIGKNSLLIDGKINDLATDGYVTAEDDSAGEETKSNVPNTSTSFLRQKYPAHKYKLIPSGSQLLRGSMRYSSYSDDDGIKESFRARRKQFLKSKATSLPQPITPVSAAQQNSADVSTFIQKKSLAQGMMDLALISANTNQLRYILEYRNDHPYFLTSLCLVIGSLFLQLAVGLTLIWNTRFNVRKRTEMMEADRVNNMSVIAIFMITLINVFLSTFGGGPQAATAVAALASTKPGTVIPMVTLAPQSTVFPSLTSSPLSLTPTTSTNAPSNNEPIILI